jgi:hypothetical protein
MGVSGQRHAPAVLYPQERTPSIHCTGGWVGPRASLDIEGREKILSLLLGIEPRSSSRPARSQTLYWLSYRLGGTMHIFINVFNSSTFIYCNPMHGIPTFMQTLRSVIVILFWVLTPYSPEDGDSMFLRKAVIYLRIYTASKPRITTRLKKNNSLIQPDENDRRMVRIAL